VIPPLRDRSSEIPVFVRTFIEDLSRKSNRTTIPDIDPEAMRLLMTYSWPGNIRELRNVIERALLLCIDDVITTEHMPVEKMGTTLPGRSSPLPPHPRPLPSPGSSAPPPRAPTSVPRPRGGYAPTRIPPPMVEIDEGDSPDDTARRSAIDIEDLRGLSPADLKSKLGDIEKDRVLAALEQCAGNQTQAAKILGISRRTLVTRLETFKLPRPRKPAPR
jgi:DNA-binding NtrC family response regulator